MRAFIDPRSGTAANIITSTPMVPGTGEGNAVTLADLAVLLGRPVSEVSPEVVGDVVRRYVIDNRDVLAIDSTQLGPLHASSVTDSLWQVSAPQVREGIPVRYARLVASLNHGNLVLLGSSMWGNVGTSAQPGITADDAIRIGFAYTGGRLPEDIMWKDPALEFIPHAPAGREIAYQPGGPIGQAYGHRLAWSFGFVRPSEEGRWEVLVDAHAGEVIAFWNVIVSVEKRVKGGVYPAANTEICPSFDRCGTMQSAYPIPWADTGLAAPNDFTNSAGVFDYTSGAVTTTLRGKFYEVTVPGCGTCSNAPATSCGRDSDCPIGGVCNVLLGETVPSGGELDLGGTNAQHRCQTSGASPRNVPSARTACYAANRIAEIARGWLPNNTWLNTTAPNQFLIKAMMPIEMVCLPEGSCIERGGCNAFYDASPPPPDEPHIGFLPGRKDLLDAAEPWVCRPWGEIPSVVDHEWGHALDDNDRPGTPGNGDKSNPGEGYADIAAMYRERASCIAYGVFGTAKGADPGCGTLTSDGTGFNQKLDQDGTPPHCFDDCNGVREADYIKHVDDVPDTPLNFVCSRCLDNVGLALGPCSREVHCDAAPMDQAAWDLVARELIAAPFFYDPATALILANKLFYQGSANIGDWYECDCNGGNSSGCGAGTGYMQWLAADDDNGNILDDTPHMTAIYGAFHKHEIACSPQESASADHLTTKGRVVPPTSYIDTFLSDGVWEILEEGLEAGKSRLEHEWRFDNVLRDVPRNLVLHGWRRSNAEGDDFKFSWSNDRVTWTTIEGAVIDNARPGPIAIYPFGGPYSPTVYIRVHDTRPNGSELDRVNIDLLAIGDKIGLSNRGCSAGPTGAPTLTVTSAGPTSASLTWTAVTGAVGYWVFRGEGHAPCDTARALITNTANTSYVDAEVAPGRQYCYSVTAVGGTGSESSQCFGTTSVCQCVTVGI